MLGVGRSVGRGERNVGKYREVLENVGKCVGMWGRCGKHGEVCLGCGKCVGVGRGEEKCGQRWGCGKMLGKFLGVWGEVRCGGRGKECTTPLLTPQHTFPHLTSQVNLKN